MGRVTSRLTYANVMATIAVFVALGGSGYAATKLQKNSVTSTTIKKGQVKNSDLGNNAVTSGKVKNGSLLAGDFKAGQLPAGATGAQGQPGAPGAKGDTGTQGAKGDKGDKGDTGNTGDTGTFGAVTVQHEVAPSDLADGGNLNIDVYCPAGQRAIGGGARGDDTLSESTIIGSTRPAISSGNTEPPVNGGTFTGWRATIVNPTGGATTGIRPEVWAICTDSP